MFHFTNSPSSGRKLALVLLVICSITSLYSQQFHSLDGIETSSGQTILLYRLGGDYYIYNPVYKLNTNTFDESLLIDAFYSNFPSGELAKSVLDFEFFPKDENNFMNVGNEINPDNHSYIARNDTIVFGGIDGFTKVDISKQDVQKVFVFGGGGPVRSWDGGYTFPLDSIPAVANFIPIALADIDDEVMFGFDEELDFCKNGGVVDTAYVGFDIYSKMLFDVNQFHIYRVNWTYGGYSLNVSNNKGNAFTWTKTYQSENPIYVAIDSTQSGVLYLADGRKIYKSVNNGYSFSEYKSLPSKLVGIYKKPNSEILYAASKSMIFKITPDSTIIIKSLPIPDETFEWFPLAIGNKWVYNQYWFDEGWPGPPIFTFAGTKNMEVTKDTLIENKKYFVVENEYISFEVFAPRMFLRVDSLTGFIYRYWEELNGEYIFHNLNPELGDTIFYPPFLENPYYILEDEQPINYLGIDTYERRYREYLPCGCYHALIKGFGLASTYFSEFGGSESTLKGCVINGVLYGDTTFVVDVEHEQNTIPTEYKLEQNYPNPFNPSTIISFQLPVAGNVTLKVFDVLGREVATLVDEYRNAGSYNVEFRIENLELSSGIYFYQLKAGEFLETKKMIHLK
jgi:hypothetical protein